MTPNVNARIAGAAFLVYIATGIGGMAIRHVAGAPELASTLTALCALVLGVTLHALTRDQDRDLALLALACRIIEAAPGEGSFFFAVGSLIFAWLLVRGALIPKPLGWLGVIASLLLVFILPAQQAGWLAGAGNWSSPITWTTWFPMLIYEVALGLWLLVRGVPAARPGSAG